MFLQLPKAMSLGVPSRRLSCGDSGVRGLRHTRPLLQRSGRPSMAELQPLPSCFPWPSPLTGSGHYGHQVFPEASAPSAAAMLR